MFRRFAVVLFAFFSLTQGAQAKEDKPDPAFNKYVENVRVVLLRQIAQGGVPAEVTQSTICRFSFDIGSSGHASSVKILEKSVPPVFSDNIEDYVKSADFPALNFRDADDIAIEATATAQIAKDGSAKVKLAIDSAKKERMAPPFRWGPLLMRILVPVVAAITVLIQSFAVVMGGFCILRQRAKFASRRSE